LNPVERAVFLLHDVFAVGYAEVAEMVDRNEASCRQIAKRARDRVRAERPRVAPDPDRDQQLLEAFLVASAADDPAALADLLHEDVVLVSDGGPHVRAARKPIVGLHRVTTFVTSIARNLEGEPTLTFAQINGQPAVVAEIEGAPTSVFIVEPDASGRKISRIYALRNPDKLSALHPLA
jgi:RNA polymerase sigma-70 factor (ECF subfamily)